MRIGRIAFSKVHHRRPDTISELKKIMILWVRLIKAFMGSLRNNDSWMCASSHFFPHCELSALLYLRTFFWFSHPLSVCVTKPS
uniref:Uncharacterized protein n=1 Tax=Caenorhabditis tropicalis TaxID=1561998 RepID=A0A1I7T5S2_9PELO